MSPTQMLLNRRMESQFSPKAAQAPNADPGFTLIELLTTIIIAGILISIAIVTYQEWANRELLKSASKTLLAWLEERRSQAMVAMETTNAGACVITINTRDAKLTASDSTATIPINGTQTSVNNLCKASKDLELKAISSSTADLNLSASGDSPSQLIFTFRGTSPSATSSNTEFKITKVNHSTATCVKVVKPLALFRLGTARPATSPCDYRQAYLDDPRRGQ